MKTKRHVPNAGRSGALQGAALCGRWSMYETGDHDLLLRQAMAALDEDGNGFCKDCLREVRKIRTIRQLDRR